MAIQNNAAFSHLRCWSAQQLSAVGAAIDEACRSWAASWDAGDAQAAANVVSADEPEQERMRSGYALHASGSADGAAKAWIVQTMHGESETVDPEHAIRRKLFCEFGGSGKPAAALRTGKPEIAVEIAAAAWLDFMERMSRCLGIDVDADVLGKQSADAAIAPEDRRNWSGAVMATVQWCGEELGFYLNGACVQKIVPARKPAAASAPATQLIPLHRAIARQPFTCTVELAPVEISLGNLRALAPGDVVVLKHPLDEPSLVRTADAAVVCGAYLGKQNGNWALELVAGGI